MRRSPLIWTSLLVLALSPRLSGAENPDLARELPRLAPKEAAEAPSTFKIHAGFKLALLGAEPLVRSPVAACFDANGRLYVVEMRGYPFPEARPTGGVCLLEDVDGDGRFDKRTEFLTGLSWPTGVVPYDGGVFVAVAPDILYAKDTDGDGRADFKETRITGFGTQNVQGLLNGLLWGTDGWIYGASGPNGGVIKNLMRPDSPQVTVRGRDFRFKPDGSALEATSGGGQFGHSFDDWGHRFVCNNSNHIRQVVLSSQDLERNPALTVSKVTTDIAADGGAGPVFRISSAEPWRVVRTRQRVTDPSFVKRAIPSELHASGFFTSATGVTIYRGSAFPAEYRGNAFIGDVGGNLVHRKEMTEAGSIFLARRADEGVEFLASTDNWFRPVNFVNTPNGTLLVLDMYRETIEHPASIPEPIKMHLDLTSGRDRGRLYEVIPDDFRRPAVPKLEKASTRELVAHLDAPNAWWRETAQRLLIERKDPSAIPLLKEMARTRPSALGRVHAIWTLNVLEALDPDLIVAAMQDLEFRVREQGAKLSGRTAAGNASVRDSLLGLANDPNAVVRFQAALALGGIADPKAVEALATIAVRDAADSWTRVAVLSSVSGRVGPLIDALAARPDFFKSSDGRAWLTDLALLVGVENKPEDVQKLLDRFAVQEADSSRALTVLLGLGSGLRRSGGSLDSALGGPVGDRVAPLFAKAARTAESTETAPAPRIDAIRLLALGATNTALQVLPTLLDARESSGVQVASIQALAGLRDRRVGPAIIGRWNAMSPTVRREAAEALFARRDRIEALLDAVETKTVAPNELDPVRRKGLLASSDRVVRERAGKLLSGESTSTRATVLADLRQALELTGAPEHGKGVFLKTCATCHRAGGQGVQVGPDLATVAGRTSEDLLVHVFDPNREVAPNYMNYMVLTKDGRTHTGVIAEETSGAVTLKRAEGAADTIARGQIEEIHSVGLSLMPEGLEQGLDHQALADLIAFIHSLQHPVSAPPVKVHE